MSTIERIQSELQEAIFVRERVPYYTHAAFTHAHKNVIRLRMELLCAQAVAAQRVAVSK